MVRTRRSNISPCSNDALPLSLLNDYLYCPRRAALKLVEGWRSANQHTLRGDIVHEHADLPGYEVAKGVTLLRALPVWSDRLVLNGKCDVVEVHPASVGDEVTRLISSPPKSDRRQIQNRREPPHVGSYERLVPVEFKLGKRRPWENHDAQLCAQALCLEEMFGITIPRGATFHEDSKRRREVLLTPELRALTEQAIGALHALLDKPSVAEAVQIPPAVFKPACEECSLFDICLPKATAADGRPERLARRLFEV